MGRYLLEFYPCEVRLDQPDITTGPKADLVSVCAQGLDHAWYPSAGIGRDYVTYRFRTEGDMQEFQRRLWTSGILEHLPTDGDATNAA